MSQSTPFYADKTSIIDEPATIGSGTKIWHYSHIMAGAQIGSNCIIGQNVYIGGKARIGNGVKIQNNVSIYDGVELEDNVFCGPSSVFTNDSNPRSEYPKHGDYKPTKVCQGATIGANATIVCNSIIGKYAFVGAGSVVTKNIPDFALVYGNPARIQGWVSDHGDKLIFSNDEAQCNHCSQRYKKINDQKVVVL